MRILKDYQTLSCCVLFIIALSFLFSTQKYYLSDFGNYYYGSKFLAEGRFDATIYEIGKFNLLVKAEGLDHFFLNYTPIPPVTSLCYLPFIFTNPFLSKIIFGLISFLFFIVSYKRLLQHLNIRSAGIVLLPLLFYIPFKSNFYSGQSYLLLSALLIEGFLAQEKKRPLLAALFWGFSIALKIFPAIILLYLVVSKQFRLFGYVLTATIVISVLPALFINHEIILNYYTHILPRLMNGDINDPFSSSYQSMQVLLKQLFIHDDLLNPTNSFDLPLIYFLLNLFFVLVILLLSITFLTNSTRSSFYKFSTTLFCGILISGYGTNYGLLLLLFPLLAFYKEREYHSFPLVTASILILFTCSVPVYRFFDLPILLRFPRLYMLLSFSLLYFYETRSKNFKWRYHPLAVFILLPAALLFNKKQTDQSFYLLPSSGKNNFSFIYDYNINQNGLQLSSIKNDYFQKEYIPFTVFIKDSNKCILRNNQLYYEGRQLTFGSDNKLKPVLINNKQLIYLSDKNRGPGFYTLRKINI